MFYYCMYVILYVYKQYREHGLFDPSGAIEIQTQYPGFLKWSSEFVFRTDTRFINKILQTISRSKKIIITNV